MFYYGPTIAGLTTSNLVQFSIDVEDGDMGQHKLLETVRNKLSAPSLSKTLREAFQLELKASYDQGASCQQLMSSVLNLNPLRSSNLFRQGTKIFITPGN
jgi:hypothetical protein